MKNIDITNFLADINANSGNYKIEWKEDNGMIRNDIVVFDKFADCFVWCDDYGFSEERATVNCEEIVSAKKCY